MVSSLGFCDEGLLANNERRLRVLDFPLADVGEGLAAYRRFFSSLRRRPALRPVVGELFDEWASDFRGLNGRVNTRSGNAEDVCM